MCARYRNSKLTFLLKDVLSGNCRATMIATVGPEEEFAQETLCTLNFASRVRSLKLGRVKKAMQREERAAKLRQQLQLSEGRSRRQIADLNKQIANLQGQLADSQQQVYLQSFVYGSVVWVCSWPWGCWHDSMAEFMIATCFTFWLFLNCQAHDAKREAARRQKHLSDAGTSSVSLKKSVADLEARLEKERATAAQMQKTAEEVS